VQTPTVHGTGTRDPEDVVRARLINKHNAKVRRAQAGAAITKIQNLQRLEAVEAEAAAERAEAVQQRRLEKLHREAPMRKKNKKKTTMQVAAQRKVVPELGGGGGGGGGELLGMEDETLHVEDLDDLETETGERAEV
jgi:hypothetical protein